MPDDVCKYCGAKSDPEQQGWKAFYLCKTGIDIDGIVFRGCQCYENQIAALQEKVVKITGQKRRLVNRLRMVNAQAEIFCDMADEADAKNAALQQGIRETVEVVRTLHHLVAGKVDNIDGQIEDLLRQTTALFITPSPAANQTSDPG